MPVRKTGPVVNTFGELSSSLSLRVEGSRAEDVELVGVVQQVGRCVGHPHNMLT